MKFSFLSPSNRIPHELRPAVYMTNILSLVLAGLTFILFFILFYFWGWVATSKFIILQGLFFLGIIALNRMYWNAGRLILCLAPVLMTMFVTLYGKMYVPNRSYMGYFDSRFILLAIAVLPAIVFKLQERSKIITCIGITFIFICFFDPIHNAVGLGYFQRGFDARTYYYINYITIVAYLAVSFGVLLLKSTTDKAEQSALLLVDKLQKANQLISEQQMKLMNANTHLEALVEEKNQSLLQINKELIKHNNELRQFSYTVSHNLRGPVARLLGLTNIAKSTSDGDQQKQVLDFVEQSAIDLDSVLKDLNRIIDIRNELYHVREKIMLDQEWNKVVSMLGENLKLEFILKCDFSKAPFVFGIRAMLHSILFNLLSNAIKYRAPDRPLAIEVSSYPNEDNQTIIEISDNGLGIDLVSNEQYIFKLYKRFHTHIEGKGLGLFLVKTQVEALNGKIEVESQLNVGTQFRITLPTPAAVDKQVFFESDAAQLYYDANINNTMLIWKRNVTSAEYRNAFETLLKTLKTYNTPGWIADLRKQGKIDDEDQVWFLTSVLPEAVQHGLKRIGAIGFMDPIRESYYKRMTAKVGELGISLQVFATFEEAQQWVQSFLHESSNK